MRNFVKIFVIVLTIGALAGLLAGCTVVLQKGRRSDIEKIESLSGQVKMTEEELNRLKDAYAALEKSLSKEIDEEKVRLGLEDRGLVVTFLDSVLFDSGKAKLRQEAHKTLDKVVAVMRKKLRNREVGVEGYTDNQPIKYSGWKSNWELSTARATSVLHYLVKRGISPEQISATGYGEYRPIASNKTAEGRQKNRRVEIVILPGKVIRAKEAAQSKYVK